MNRLHDDKSAITSVEIPDLQTLKTQKQNGFKGSDHFLNVCVHNVDMTRVFFFFRTVYLFTPGYSYANMNESREGDNTRADIFHLQSYKQNKTFRFTLLYDPSYLILWYELFKKKELPPTLSFT